MKQKFELTDFPNCKFEITTSIFTGKSKLYMNDVELKKSSEKGKPFVIPKADGTTAFAFPKQSFPDFAPKLEINGEIYRTASQLKWYEYTIGGLPILLVVSGGLIGGILGFVASIKNFNILREEKNTTIKYGKVLGILLLSFITYILLVTLFTMAIQ